MIEMFKPTRTWDQLQHTHRHYQSVVCGSCGFTENVPVTKHVALAPEVIVKRMQAKKWLMGQKRKNDLCPRCAKGACSAALAQKVFRSC